MSTSVIDSATATVATSGRRPTKSNGGRNSVKSAKAKPAKKSRQSKAEAKPKTRRANKKAEVIELMRRPSGATLAEIIETTKSGSTSDLSGDLPVSAFEQHTAVEGPGLRFK